MIYMKSVNYFYLVIHLFLTSFSFSPLSTTLSHTHKHNVKEKTFPKNINFMGTIHLNLQNLPEALKSYTKLENSNTLKFCYSLE